MTLPKLLATIIKLCADKPKDATWGIITSSKIINKIKGDTMSTFNCPVERALELKVKFIDEDQKPALVEDTPAQLVFPPEVVVTETGREVYNEDGQDGTLATLLCNPSVLGLWQGLSATYDGHVGGGDAPVTVAWNVDVGNLDAINANITATIVPKP